jgi:hypothetical protein
MRSGASGLNLADFFAGFVAALFFEVVGMADGRNSSRVEGRDAFER